MSSPADVAPLLVSVPLPFSALNLAAQISDATAKLALEFCFISPFPLRLSARFPLPLPLLHCFDHDKDSPSCNPFPLFFSIHIHRRILFAGSVLSSFRYVNVPLSPRLDWCSRKGVGTFRDLPCTLVAGAHLLAVSLRQVITMDPELADIADELAK